MRGVFSFLFLVFGCLSAYSQTHDTDIFSAKNSLRYAAYLEKQGDYLLAAREYERLAYTFSLDSLRTPALRNYYKTSDWQLSLNKAGQLFPDKKLMPNQASILLNKTYIQLEKYDSLLESDSIKQHRYEGVVCYYIVDLADLIKLGKYRQVDIALRPNCWSGFYQCDSSQKQEMRPVIQMLYNHKEKSPAKALLLSAIIPGSGKFYTGEWKDGLASLIMVGLSGYQSYRGFKKQGAKSAYGYIYAGLTLGFYSGNLYGSWHSAKRQNRLFNQKIRKETQNALLRMF